MATVENPENFFTVLDSVYIRSQLELGLNVRNNPICILSSGIVISNQAHIL